MEHTLQFSFSYEITCVNYSIYHQSASFFPEATQGMYIRFNKMHLSTVDLDMWTMKRSSQFAFFGLVLGCCKVLVYCSSRSKQHEEVEQRSYLAVRKSGFKRLGLHLQSPTCLPNLENAEETDVAGQNKDKIPQVNVSVFQKDFRFPAGMQTSLFFFSSFRSDNPEFHFLFTYGLISLGYPYH